MIVILSKEENERSGFHVLDATRNADLVLVQRDEPNLYNVIKSRFTSPGIATKALFKILLDDHANFHKKKENE